MKRSTIVLSAVIICVLSITSILLVVYQPWNLNKVKINFVKEEIKSYPGQKTWLLAEIYTKKQIIFDQQIQVSIDQSVDSDLAIWSTTGLKTVEIFLYPNDTHIDLDITVSLKVNDGRSILEETAIIDVVNWSSSYSDEIREMKSTFTDFLIENYSSFNIAENKSMEFMGNIPQILIVEHYLFRSDSWELELSRHVMLTPYDWVRVYLRARNSIQPCWAGTITSWGSGNHTIYEMNPPESIFR